MLLRQAKTVQSLATNNSNNFIKFLRYFYNNKKNDEVVSLQVSQIKNKTLSIPSVIEKIYSNKKKWKRNKKSNVTEVIWVNCKQLMISSELIPCLMVWTWVWMKVFKNMVRSTEIDCWLANEWRRTVDEALKWHKSAFCVLFNTFGSLPHSTLSFDCLFFLGKTRHLYRFNWNVSSNCINQSLCEYEGIQINCSKKTNTNFHHKLLWKLRFWR